ncbi:CrcB-like protein [Trypanosoma cruzi]|nr:CrcB-like protein [Trypanosoma cruzi]
MMPSLGCIIGISASRYELGGRQMRLANVIFLFVSVVAAVVVPVAIEASVHRDLLNVSFINRRSVVISPLGAVPRYLLAQLWNGSSRFWNFPIGTFAANMIAVLLMGLLDHFYRTRDNVWCKIAMDGLCGSLSTVSSFVNEMIGFYDSDNRRLMYIYAIISVGVGAAIISVCRHVF